MLSVKQRLIRQLRFKKEMAKLKATWKRGHIRRYPRDVVIAYYRDQNGLYPGNLRRL